VGWIKAYRSSLLHGLMVFLSVDNPGAAGCFSGIVIHQGFMGKFQDAEKNSI